MSQEWRKEQEELIEEKMKEASKKQGKSSYALGFGMSDLQSSSTLQHSVPIFSFSKSNRFQREKATGSDVFYNIPSTKNSRFTSFGQGSKQGFVASNLKEAPSPDKQAQHGDFTDSKSAKGKSFGLPYSAYLKTQTKGFNFISPDVSKELPGPGSQDPAKLKNKDQKGWSFLPRREEIGLKRQKAPPSNFQSPLHRLVTNSRFNGITFGFGNKSAFLVSKFNKMPGPGTYESPSFVEKIVRKTKTSKSRRPNNIFL